MTDWARLRDDLYWERGDKWLHCEIEGCKKFPYELHHVFQHGIKGLEKYLDVKYNLQWVCKAHHDSIANSEENENYFWGVQCARYGRDFMENWMNSLPFKIELPHYS